MKYDLLIENGHLIDGSGNPWFKADVGVIGNRIEALGRLAGQPADNTINAKGLIVAPGFIDIHGHSDYPVLIDPKVESKIRQGVTTEVSGNCGNSPAPMNDNVKAYREQFMRAGVGDDFHFSWTTMADYLNRIDEKGASFNVVALVGQGTIRQNVMGFDDRQPTDTELKKMQKLLDEAMVDGAWGMSSGLVTTPSCYADSNELSALAEVVAKRGGVYYCHIRGEGETLFEALNEAIGISERTGVSLEIPHFKASGKENWGKTTQSLAMIEEARKIGIDVTVDQYPYVASSISLSALIPPWAHSGGAEKLIERLRDPEMRRKIKDQPARLTRDLSTVVISSAKKNPQYEGKKVTEIATAEGKDPMDAVFDLLISEEAQVGMVQFGMSEEDVQQVMRSPYTMICSDGLGISPRSTFSRGKPHPRYYGAFPRVLGHYVREGVLNLQEAIRKMTSMPAQRIGLRDRGLLREGFKADITVFDPERIRDEATFVNPHRFPTGIAYVVVNGIPVIDRGEHTGKLPGTTLKKAIIRPVDA